MNIFKKVGFVIVVSIAASFFFSFSVTETFAQKGGKGRYRKISLKKDARKNGYSITLDGAVAYFEAKKVEDPVTEKLLEGLRQLEYRCRQDDPELYISIIFTRGNSERVAVSCPVLIEPTILIGEVMDE